MMSVSSLDSQGGAAAVAAASGLLVPHGVNAAQSSQANSTLPPSGGLPAGALPSSPAASVSPGVVPGVGTVSASNTDGRTVSASNAFASPVSAQAPGAVPLAAARVSGGGASGLLQSLLGGGSTGKATDPTPEQVHQAAVRYQDLLPCRAGPSWSPITLHTGAFPASCPANGEVLPCSPPALLENPACRSRCDRPPHTQDLLALQHFRALHDPGMPEQVAAGERLGAGLARASPAQAGNIPVSNNAIHFNLPQVRCLRCVLQTSTPAHLPCR